ncbi:hypothetical protein TSUD_240070 [Trifolium subterraneum]|uniref:Uncharacterized protein n=1 Tax=Trifolium subterraneum TaxID=3900 RepID=A0A2Z6NZ82_TRISU|nr:hypothetical protein TSUD_240070 [Trifolium subterraneum]
MSAFGENNVDFNHKSLFKSLIESGWGHKISLNVSVQGRTQWLYRYLPSAKHFMRCCNFVLRPRIALFIM